MSSKKYSILYAINLTLAVFFCFGITAVFSGYIFFRTEVFTPRKDVVDTVQKNRTSFGFVMIEYLWVFYFPDNSTHVFN